MKNPLLDEDFLLKLEANRNREIFARIILLDINELPIEQIEGKVTGGSINIDGDSAVRRSCSLTLIAKEINLNDFYWGVKSKFFLEIGLRNNINLLEYSDIIWFRQGTFVITSFNAALGVNNYTINISGKDKMCLLNGDLAGNIMNISEDFGVKWIWKNNEHTEYVAESIPIKEIIYKGVQTYAGELPQNIIINDIAECGFELLSYRGTTPIYLIKNNDDLIYENMTTKGDMTCYINGTTATLSTIEEFGGKYELEISTEINQTGYAPSPITFSDDDDDNNKYYIYKITAGMTPGYRPTELVYAGELLASAGESFTSVLDKIVQMLGNFEYFYDLDGHFVFQRKKNYVTGNWTGLAESETDDEKVAYAESNDNNGTFSYIFDDNYLITNIQNSPNLANVKNDYTVWGVRTSSSGAEIPIHMRCAIDTKPTYYKTYDEKVFSIENGDDWREILYQMAQDYYHNNSNDDFYVKIRKNNTVKIKDEIISYYPTGRTGYERYYTDMEAFWRSLYTPIDGITIDKTLPVDKDTYGTKGYWVYNDSIIGSKPEHKDFLDAVDIISVDKNKKYRFTNKEGKTTTYETYDSNQTYYDKQQSSINIKQEDNLFFSSFGEPTAFGESDDDIIKQNDIYNTKQLKKIKEFSVKENRETNYYKIKTGTSIQSLKIGKEYLMIDDEHNYFIQTPIPDTLPDGCYYGYIQKEVNGDKLVIITDKTTSIKTNTQLKVYKVVPNIVADESSSAIADNNAAVLVSDDINYMLYTDANGEEISITVSNQYVYYSEYQYSIAFTLYPNYKYTLQDDTDNKVRSILTSGSYNVFINILGEDLDSDGKHSIQKYILKNKSGVGEQIIQVRILFSFLDYTTYNWEMADKDDLQSWTPINIFVYKEELKNYKYYTQKIDTNVSAWSPTITENPELLTFWIDFLDPIENGLEKYSVQQIGPRPKVVNENTVKAIYYRETPNVIFQEAGVESEFSNQPGYTYININSSQKSLFHMSSQGVSAKDKMENLLNNYTFAAENISISGVPIYRLDVNTKISVKDVDTGIQGEYVVSKISIPLTYNGTMNITASKKVKLIY